MVEQRHNLSTVKLNTPVSTEDLEKLEIGNVVYLDGTIMTGREGVYQRLLVDGMAPPDDLGRIANVNFHCSPAASVNDDGTFNVGAVTATASFRFAKWLPQWFEMSGCRMIIGKGGMSEAHYRDIFVPAKAVYLTTVGYGTGALLGRGIVGVEAAHWLDDLGIAQAMWVFKVKDFGPLLVESDLAGNSLFETNNRAINAQIEKAYEGLKPPALSRYGETNDKTRELI
ncbi:MAG: fumarate hydratase [Chromatiales bacterium]|jgi:L(+)-tartrate dehydratase beta subunit|nr:fumarate hydratase [Chromatiales bacterium]